MKNSKHSKWYVLIPLIIFSILALFYLYEFLAILTGSVEGYDLYYLLRNLFFSVIFTLVSIFVFNYYTKKFKK